MERFLPAWKLNNKGKKTPNSSVTLHVSQYLYKTYSKHYIYVTYFTSILHKASKHKGSQKIIKSHKPS